MRKWRLRDYASIAKLTECVNAMEREPYKIDVIWMNTYYLPFHDGNYYDNAYTVISVITNSTIITRETCLYFYRYFEEDLEEMFSRYSLKG